MSPHEVIVGATLSREEALERLCTTHRTRYDVTRTPEDYELFFSRFPGTRVIAKVFPLAGGRTCFQVRADDVWWAPAVYGRLISARKVARAIQDALG